MNHSPCPSSPVGKAPLSDGEKEGKREGGGREREGEREREEEEEGEGEREGKGEVEGDQTDSFTDEGEE